MKYLFVILGIVVALSLLSASFSLDVNILNADGTTLNTIDYSTSYNYYLDNQIIVEVCNQSAPPAYYVSLAYGINETNGRYVIVSKSLVQTSDIWVQLGDSYQNSDGLWCRNATVATIGNSPTIANGLWGYPTWPAILWVGLSNDDVTSSDDTFMPTNVQLVGSYTLSGYYFNYTTGNITFGISHATINGGSVTSADSSFQDRDFVVYGICDDQQGLNCFSVGNATFENIVGQDKVNLYSGHPNMNDKEVYTVYVVVNGLEVAPINLGANLKPSVSVSSPVYWGEKVPVTVTITNNGNVPVTDPFNVTIEYTDPNGVVDNTYTTTVDPSTLSNGEIAPLGGTTTVTFDLPWKFAETGQGNITVTVDPNNIINETNENDNEETVTVNLEPSYNISLQSTNPFNTLITSFPNSKVPYGVNITVYEQPGNSPVDATLVLVEENGTIMLDPEVTSGTKTTVTLNVPSTGLITTIVPTMNGSENYKLYFTGLHFYNGSDVVTEWDIPVISSSDDNNELVSVGNIGAIQPILSAIGRVYYHIFVEVVGASLPGPGPILPPGGLE